MIIYFRTIYELSPAITLVEQAIISKTAKIFGYPDDADGTFTPGGSISNMYAVAISRYNAYPNVREDGMAGLPRLVLLTSDDVSINIKINRKIDFYFLSEERSYFRVTFHWRKYQTG